MKKFLIGVLAFTLFSACCDDTNNVGNPLCINDEIETFKADPQSIAVLKTNLDGHFYYWLQTEAPWSDGTDNILDENCEVYCAVGGKRIDACICDDINFCELEYDTLWHR